MKQGGKNLSNRSREGFTIVETLIVLSITALMSVSALALIGNRQHNTEFNVAVHDLQQQIQQVFNETQSGYFPQSNTLTCDATAAGKPVLNSNGSSQQGTNSGCTFLGKAIQLVGDNPSKYITYPIVGRQFDYGTANQVTSLATAFPEAIAAGTTTSFNSLNTDNSPFIGLELPTTYENGIYVQSMYYCTTVCNSPTKNIGAFAYLTDFSSVTQSSGQQFRLYAIDPSGAVGSGLSDPALTDNLADVLKYKPAGEVDICVTDGGNHSGLLTIGSTQATSQASVAAQVFTTGDCT